MIKIIKGTYGYFDGTKVVPKTSEDGSFSLGSEKEARLVRLGVAEYVNEPQGMPNAQGSDNLGDNGDGIGSGASNIESLRAASDAGMLNYSKMSLVDLKALALTYGIDASKITAKARVAELIEVAKDQNMQKTDPPEGDSDAEPPKLDAVTPLDGDGGV